MYLIEEEPWMMMSLNILSWPHPTVLLGVVSICVGVATALSRKALRNGSRPITSLISERHIQPNGDASLH